jgi:hypothetical protein
MSAKRWTVEGHIPFFSKGRGRSYMVSNFLVQHPSGPFFSLSDAEYRKAVKRFPLFLVLMILTMLKIQLLPVST